MPHQAVLDFWFSENSRRYWFQPSDAFDQTIRQQFADIFQAALANQLAHWRNTLHGRVAEIIVLGLFIFGLRSGFGVRKWQMQGANHSKVEHFARICNAADAVLWRKSRRNTKYKQPPNQFSRNIYRHQPQAFTQDERALQLAQEAVSQPQFAALPYDYRQFALLPYMHSESLAVHQQAQALFARYTNEHVQAFERKHRNLIAQFGRYPHRNALLSRPNTPSEAQFLAEHGRGF